MKKYSLAIKIGLGFKIVLKNFNNKNTGHYMYRALHVLAFYRSCTFLEIFYF